jgi:hypothetical protein
MMGRMGPSQSNWRIELRARNSPSVYAEFHRLFELLASAKEQGLFRVGGIMNRRTATICSLTGQLLLASAVGATWIAEAESRPLGPEPGRLTEPSRSAPSAGSHNYHVELNTVRDCLTGDCPWRYSGKNFAVSQDGREFPLRIGRQGAGPSASYPTHLLVLFASGATRPSDDEIVRDIRGLTSRGWLVSVARQDGSITPYVLPTDLSDTLAAKPALPAASGDAEAQM